MSKIPTHLRVPQRSLPRPIATAGNAAPKLRTRRTMRVNRRTFLIGSGAAGLGAYAAARYLIARRGQFANLLNLELSAEEKIGHIVRRAGFGATPAELQRFQSMGYAATVDHLLNYARQPDTALEQKLAALQLDITNDLGHQRIWWLTRMVFTTRPFLEKMTLFWSGLLTSSFFTIGTQHSEHYMIDQNTFLREHALDTYDNILLGITGDAAMLWYLNLNTSTRDNPNENYARELMELFSLGAHGGYTQKDVHEAARALTGWSFPTLDGPSVPVYNPANHDESQKTLLGVTGNLDYKDVVRIVAGHKSTGLYLSRRIFRFFVHENPTDDDIKPMVDAYYAHGHDMGAVMRAMFLSPAFTSRKAYRSRMKSPVEFVVSLLRTMQFDFNRDGAGAMFFYLSLMGQMIMDPPNVAGWPGDQYSENWLSSGTLLTRFNFVNLLLNGSYTLAKDSNGINAHLQDMLTSAGVQTSSDIIDYFSGLLIDHHLTDDQRQQLLNFLVASANGPTIHTGNGTTVPASGVRGIVYLMLCSPQFMLN